VSVQREPTIKPSTKFAIVPASNEPIEKFREQIKLF
jgi:hypothetical protein